MTQCGQCGQINECSTGLVLDWGNICWGFSNKFDILHIFPALGLSSPGPGPATSQRPLAAKMDSLLAILSTCQRRAVQRGEFSVA